MLELHVVALSGGKDSTAMALQLAELGDGREFTYICTPTGDEPEEMFAHWRRLGDMLGKPILPIVGGTLSGLIERQKALPNFRMRWCTRMLKIEPYAAWLIQQQPNYSKIVSYVGLRADEPERQGGDYSIVPGIEMRFPMREWGWRLKDVLAYLAAREIEIPERTDCQRCFYQTLGEWFKLWLHHSEVYAHAEAQEAATGHTFRSAGRDTWPASLVGLRQRFERGEVPKGQLQTDLFRGQQCRVCRI